MTPDETETLEVQLLIEGIRRKYGYDLGQYDPGSMRRRLLSAMVRNGAAHLGDLQHQVLTNRELFFTVFDQLTVQVSDMFRDPSFHRAFRTRVVPLLRTYPQLKIWHAGCAGGEEVYAMAILLLEENLYERTQVYATDVSAAALDRAKEGVYPEASYTVFAKNYAESGGTARFDDYCSRAYGRMALSEALRKNIVFFQHDLATDYALGEMHVILCRNVLIYFGGELRERVLRMFSQSLTRNGILCLGSSEALPQSCRATFADYIASERVYQLRAI